MQECCGCDATDNLRRMDVGKAFEDEMGGPQYICARCDDDATELFAEFMRTEA